MSTKRSIRRSISLTEHEVVIIEMFSKRTGIKNISAAVRYIINEWAHDHNIVLEPLPDQHDDPVQTDSE